jgi:CRISPR-associated endonuclease/helicase Cas3
MRVNPVKWSIVSGIHDNKLIIILRNDGVRKNAGRVAKTAFSALGSAGGHRSMARAELPLEKLADFLDTEAFMKPDKPAMRLGYRPLAELGIKFDAYMDKKSQTAPKTAVNAIRQEILATCRATAKQATGLYTLTVPTGGGKTLSGMAFALDHAAHHKKRRIIYVIPYTSIIEQTANTLKEIFGETNVVEHHSNMEPGKETQRSRLASENWDAPVIVTTNVQFFESLYAAKSSRCRKLHNIADSVVILDEAQLLPPDLLTPCVAVMNQLVRNYGVTMVLSTATQPALPGLGTPTEIIPPGMNLYGRLKRTDIRMPTDIHAPLDWPSLAGQLQTDRRDAAARYRSLRRE